MVSILAILVEIPLMVVFLFPERTSGKEYYQHYSCNFLIYLPSYAIGFIIGLILFENRKYKMTWKKIFFFRMIGISTLLYATFYTFNKIQQNDLVNTDPSILTYLTMASTNVSFSVFVGYLLYNLTTDPTSFASRFLSHKFFLPFSKLSFGIYLLHSTVITFNTFQTRSLISYDNINNIVSIHSFDN